MHTPSCKNVEDGRLVLRAAYDSVLPLRAESPFDERPDRESLLDPVTVPHSPTRSVSDMVSGPSRTPYFGTTFALGNVRTEASGGLPPVRSCAKFVTAACSCEVTL